MKKTIKALLRENRCLHTLGFQIDGGFGIEGVLRSFLKPHERGEFE